jgi:phage major head subunit gpT-like protein
MILNKLNLAMLTQGFKASFQAGLASAAPRWNRVAMKIPSTTSENVYTWLGETFTIREWIGEREYQNLVQEGFTIKNKSYEGTIRVKRDDIADDQYGQYGMRFQHMGNATALHPDELVFKLLKDGFTKTCFDGQFFFDTDHPVGKPGSQVSVSNTMGGAGRPWVIMDSKQMLKPIIFQEREPFKMVSRTSEEDPAVFDRKEYIYGVDGRCNVGYGLWQLAVASKQTLDLAGVKAAITQMRTFKKDNGQPLDLEPDLIVVAPEDAEAARDLFSKELIANETNTLRNRLNVVSTGYFS